MRSASLRRGLVLPACLAALLLTGCGHLLPCAAAVVPKDLPAGGSRIDPEHASLPFKLDQLGFSQLVGRFDAFDGALDLDPAAPEAARLTVLVEVASIDLDLPGVRGETARAEWIDATRFLQARFDGAGD